MSITSLLRSEVSAALAVALVLGLLLLALRPADRASTRNALVLLVLCAFAELVDSFIASMVGAQVAAIAADVASVLIGVVVIRLGTIFFFRVALPAIHMGAVRITEDLSTAALYVAWGLLWLRLSGVDLASLVATSAVITGVIAFSMQETLGNVLGGVVLQLDNSINVGDWMRVDQVGGRVVEIGWRHTAIVTRDRETVIVPNGWLMKNRFSVIGVRDAEDIAWRRWVRINVDFSASPGDVCRVLADAVRNAAIPSVRAEPAPDVVLLEIAPRFGTYALRYWLQDPARDDPTDSAVRQHMLAALARNGMRLGVPYVEELRVRDNDSQRESARAAEHARRVDALAHVELFATLSAEERERLADHLSYAPFLAGDVMTHQGAVAHWLYLIVSGEADVWYEHDGTRTLVSPIGAGTVFGEMGMMTGEQRQATVTARTDVVCYRLDKAGFGDIIKARPDIADGISRVLAARITELRARRDAAAHLPEVRHEDILARVRHFFALD
jgi:small-conductance mechanosensitive channel/CRP-like cAMP-binding protein